MPYAVMLWQMYKTREGPDISELVVSGMFLAETPSEQAVTRQQGNCLRVLEGGGKERSSVPVAAGFALSALPFLLSCRQEGQPCPSYALSQLLAPGFLSLSAGPPIPCPWGGKSVPAPGKR